MSSTPTPTPTAEPEHTLAFRGDCANVLTIDEVRTLIGPNASPSAPDSRAVNTGIGTLGGIACQWESGEGSMSGPNGVSSLLILAAPLSSVSESLSAEIAGARCDPVYDTSICRLGRAVGDVWLMAGVDSIDDTAAPHADLLDRALTASAARVAAFPEPVRLASTSEWWAMDECTDLGARMGLEDILGEGYVTGWWEGDISEMLEHRLTESQGVERLCQWYPDSERDPSSGISGGVIAATVWPGGAWNADGVLAGGSPITVAGAQRAVVDGQYPEVARAVTAVNAAEAYAYLSDGSADVADVLARLLAALDR